MVLPFGYFKHFWHVANQIKIYVTWQLFNVYFTGQNKVQVDPQGNRVSTYLKNFNLTNIDL